MRIWICGKVLLVGACMMIGYSACGQQARSSHGQAHSSTDVAIVYHSLSISAAGSNNNWLQGGSVQVHGQFWHGLGVVADIAGVHVDNLNGSRVGLDMVTATFGPRYTWSSSLRHYSIFGQALAGEANAFHSVFPAREGALDSTNSLALQVGGGVNLPVTRHISIRALQVDWLHTQLPNNSGNVQNNLRMGAGLIYRF